MKEGGVAPYNSLKHISVVIASKCYQDLRRRDCRFVRTPLHKPSSRGHAVISERIDWAEIVLDKVFRESFLVSLAHEIASIPKKQRTALLIELANCTHFNAWPSLMQIAFSEADISLQDYQRPLPNDPIERSKHAYQLQLACKQIMKKQKKPEEQNTIEVRNKGQEPTFARRDADADSIQNDPKLVALAAHLDATAPFATVSPAFRQALRNRLLERLTEHQIPEATERSLEQVPGGASSQEQIAAEVIHSDLLPPSSYRDPGSDSIQTIGILPASVAEPANGQELVSSSRDPEPDIIGNNPELARLVTYLNETAPSAVVDPIFRKKLREKLIGTSAEHYVTKAVEGAPDNMSEVELETAFQELFLVSLVHEIVDFPDEERKALLTDLASRTRSESERVRLQQALLEVGIRLQDYESLLPDDSIKQKSHNFFLNLAYKRVGKLQEVLGTSANIG